MAYIRKKKLRPTKSLMGYPLSKCGALILFQITRISIIFTVLNILGPSILLSSMLEQLRMINKESYIYNIFIRILCDKLLLILIWKQLKFYFYPSLIANYNLMVRICCKCIVKNVMAALNRSYFIPINLAITCVWVREMVSV